MKKILSGMKLEQIEKITADLKGSKYRAKQIYARLYSQSAACVDEMTELPKDFRAELEKVAVVTDTKIKQRQISKDGTIKYLIEYPDGNCVETVLMRFDNRANLTACISSQIGCALGCKFCLTAKRGFVRNLTSYEMAEQVLNIQRDTKLKVTNVVFMGQGEPLLNLDNVLGAIEIFNKNLQIGARRITLSTCGIIPGIEKLAGLDFQSTLAISIHAPCHELRKSLMPVEAKYSLDKLIPALRTYTEKTGRRVTIEYILIKNINDSFEHAKALADLIYKLKCNVNLIAYNETDNPDYKKPTKDAVMKFKYILEHSGKKVTVRLERGADIDAACGQLSGK